jgi:hypothetical protein
LLPEQAVTTNQGGDVSKALLESKVERLESERAMMLAALNGAKRWMVNAIEVGYVPKPQPGTPEHKALADVQWAVACVETFDEQMGQVKAERAKVEVYSHPDCILNYCPHPDVCRPGCVSPTLRASDVDRR